MLKKLIITLTITINLINSGFSNELHILINEKHKEFFINNNSKVQNEIFYKKSKIKVFFETYKNNQDLLSQLKATPNYFDIILSYHNNLDILQKHNVITKIDKQKLNLTAKQLLLSDDKTIFNYSCPYLFESIGLLFRNDIIQHKIESWSEFFKPISLMKNKLGFYLNPTTIYAIIALYNKNLNLTKQQINKKFSHTLYNLKNRDFINFYYKDLTIATKELTQNNGIMAITSSSEAIKIKSLPNGDKFTFITPKEGTIIFIDGFCLVKGSKNIEDAYKFINYQTKIQVQAAKTAYLKFGCPNIYTYKNYLRRIAPAEIRGQPIYPTPKELNRCILNPPQIPKTAKKYWDIIFNNTLK